MGVAAFQICTSRSEVDSPRKFSMIGSPRFDDQRPKTWGAGNEVSCIGRQTAIDSKETEIYINRKLSRQVTFAKQNNFVTPMLTDLYELTMVYSYFMWKKHTEIAVFDLFFRKCPFKGKYAVFCGLEDCLRFLKSFRFTDKDITYLREIAPAWDPTFLDYLKELDCSKVKLYAQPEGGVCQPRIPMIRVEGPLGVCQLLETTLLNLVNFSSLIATNAARHRQAVGPDVVLLEFGLRRAQGPDGGMTASRFSFVGGYNGTSNVAAGRIFDIPVKGTHAHSYVTSFKSFDELHRSELPYAEEEKEDKKLNLVKRVKYWRGQLQAEKTNEGELVAFTAYALDYPSGFIALIDTYSTLNSGMINFVVVGMALIEAGYKPIGVRIDSGDIISQSLAIRAYLKQIGKKYKKKDIAEAAIFASDGITEDNLHEYSAKGAVSAYGVGTNLVTCKKQPALGAVYKLVELGGEPRIKLSEDPVKTTIPGKKNAFRVYSERDEPICDVMAASDESIGCGSNRFRYFTGDDAGNVAIVNVFKKEALLNEYWSNGAVRRKKQSIQELRTFCMSCVNKLPLEHRRKDNPKPYPLFLTEKLYNILQKMIQAESK